MTVRQFCFYRDFGTSTPELSLCGGHPFRIWRHTRNPNPQGPAHRTSNLNAGSRGAPRRRAPSSSHSFLGRRRCANDRVVQRCGYQKHRDLRGQPEFLPDQGAIYDAMRTIRDNYEATIDAGQHDPAKLIIYYWGVDGSFNAMQDATQDYCLATVASNILD